MASKPLPPPPPPPAPAAVAAISPTNLSPEAAVAHIAAECERLSLPPGKIIDGQMLYRLSSVTLRHFARLGWMHEVNHRLSEERGRPELQSLQSDEAAESRESAAAVAAAAVVRPARPGRHPIHGRNPFGEWKPLAHIKVMVADRTMKALLDFTLTDIRYWQTQCYSQAAGWAKRGEYFDQAEAAMVAAGAGEDSTLGGLKAAELKRLGEVAQKAWSAKADE